MSGDDAAGVAGSVQINEAYDWQAALDKADALVYAGFDDWRLPNLKEMQTLVDYGTSEPSIDLAAFPLPFDEYVSSYFWTSTTFSDVPIATFYTNFLNGHTFRFAKVTRFTLRPVRSVNVDDPIALLKTGQTVGYIGNNGQVQGGNSDGGDLQLGLAQQY